MALIDPLVAAMIAYFVITILIAWWYGRGAGAGYVEFTLAGKNLSLVPFTMTYFATFVGRKRDRQKRYRERRPRRGRRPRDRGS